MSIELKEWLKSINQTKINIMDDDPDTIKEYIPYVINRCFSGSIDSVMYSNEMNMKSFLDKKLQYDFYINSLRKRKRFSPWLKREIDKDLECIKTYYGYSNEKARQVLNILTKDQLKFIKNKIDIGGMR